MEDRLLGTICYLKFTTMALYETVNGKAIALNSAEIKIVRTHSPGGVMFPPSVIRWLLIRPVDRCPEAVMALATRHP